jgi:peptidoglycan/xylan/chitin deacetylase (PgdA/CDA1 family)
MKRLLLANMLNRFGVTSALLRARRPVALPWLPIITFHRVIDPTKNGAYLFDDGVVDASPVDFERRIQTIRRYFTPVGIDDLVASMEGVELPTNPILVTFDDGYKDNIETALPILKRNHCKAVFFIATHYLSERRVFWWDRINYLFKRSTRSKVKVTFPWDIEFSLRTKEQRDAAIRGALRIVKCHYALDLERFLEELAVATGVTWNDDIDRSLANEVLMTWDQVRELQRAGMDVQSHTRTHRVLQTLTARQLQDELRGSREDLEAQLSIPINSISYPVGHRLLERDDVRRALRDAGYKLGFTNATGTHRVRRESDPYDVSRIAVEMDTPDSLFRAMLAAPPRIG